MSENCLAKCKRQALQRWIHRGIGGMENYMECFQMGPHRGGRIRQATVCEGVASQKETEFVIDKRLRDRQPGQDSGTHYQSRNTANQDAEAAASGHSRKRLF